jgi:hypothetical protein
LRPTVTFFDVQCSMLLYKALKRPKGEMISFI